MATLTFIPAQELVLPDAPRIPGLRFRTFQGDQDFPGMLQTLNISCAADQEDRVVTLEDITNTYQHMTNCDPYQDVLIAEVNGEMVAYGRVSWRDEDATKYRIFQSFAYMRPEWRSKGIDRAMLLQFERRMRAVAEENKASEPAGTVRFFEAFCSNLQPGNQALIESEGYTPIRWGYFMVRPDLQNIPDLPLPEGLEVRPARPEQYRQIWDASQEAFRDHWGYVEATEENYQEWLSGSEFQPELWQVAWDGDQVAGMILNFINHAENETFNRKRGWTEAISVRRPWRRRGLARALLARSMRMHRDLGMTETALGVDADNPNGARQLYESMGYQTVRVSTSYRKPMD